MSAATLAGDTFTLATHAGTGPGGVAVSGDPLNGTSTEVGGGTWTADAQIKLFDEAGNGIAAYNGGDPVNATAPVSYSPGQIITASANIRPVSGGGDNWVALGLTDQNFVVSFTGAKQTQGGQPWMLLRNSGNFSGFSGPGIQSNAGGTDIPNFNGNVFHHVSITYDPTTHNNGTSTFGQVTMTVDSTSSSFDMLVNPNITRAGFAFHGGALIGSAVPMGVDNLQVTSVPEPAVLGVLGIGGIGMLMRRRHD